MSDRIPYAIFMYIGALFMCPLMYTDVWKFSLILEKLCHHHSNSFIMFFFSVLMVYHGNVYLDDLQKPTRMFKHPWNLYCPCINKPIT